MSREKMKDPSPVAASVAGVAGAFALGRLDQLLNFRLRRLRNYLTARYRVETARLGLAAGAFSVLALIEANPGVAQIDLARFGGYDQTVLVGIIDDLEGRGWARRSRDPSDRRRHRVEVTPEGVAALDDMLTRAIRNEKPACDVLSEDELQSFRIMLDKIYKTLL